jgi:hypothetical protein
MMKCYRNCDSKRYDYRLFGYLLLATYCFHLSCIVIIVVVVLLLPQQPTNLVTAQVDPGILAKDQRAQCL